MSVNSEYIKRLNAEDEAVRSAVILKDGQKPYAPEQLQEVVRRMNQHADEE